MRLIALILFIATLSSTAFAEVTKSDAGGFIIQHTATVSKDTETVFTAMTQVGEWWNSSHTYSGDAGNMYIDQHCFCERWERNLVRHLNTAIWMQDSRLVFEGGLGPLKDFGLEGTMIWSLSPADDGGTTIAWKYYVNGFTDTDVVEFAPVVDGVLAEQFGNLTNFLK